MKFTFQQQILAGVALVIAAYALSYALDTSYIINLAWTAFGLGFIFNPVYPDTIRLWFQEKAPMFMRILGVALIIGGWIPALEVGLGPS